MKVKNTKDKEILTQKERNIASNLTYRKNHNMKKWYRFWIICGISLVISEISLAWFVKIPLESYMLASLVAIVAINANFLGSTFIAAEYDPLRRAVCHMGKLKSYHGIVFMNQTETTTTSLIDNKYIFEESIEKIKSSSHCTIFRGQGKLFNSKAFFE